MAHVLIVDTDPVAASLLTQVLARAEHTSQQVSSVRTAISALETGVCDVVIVELKLGDESGLALLESMTSYFPGLPAIMVAGESTVPQAVEAMRSGAADFLLKPFVGDEILYVLKKALAGSAAQSTRPPDASPTRNLGLLGDSEPMQQVRERIRRASSSTATVLIRGESGTGKELVARAIHAASERCNKPFVKIDCASLPDTLLESELFGYEKGAFTGAANRKPGRVELADHGSLFLDEIGEVSAAMQAKLLRLLQDREFERLGGKQTQSIDVRFILATHRDLETMVKNGTFRQDLFYRLNVVPLWIPPLRARRDDIELLARQFCERFAAAAGRPVQLSPEAIKLLRSQRWPGNVRQLENLVERLVVLSDGPTIGVIDVEREFAHKPQFVTQSTGAETEQPAARDSGRKPLVEALRAAETNALLTALKGAGGNRSVAARVLGVSRTTLYNKLKELGIEQA